MTKNFINLRHRSRISEGRDQESFTEAHFCPQMYCLDKSML